MAFCSTISDRQAAAIERDDGLEQFLGGLRRQAGGRLVEQQQHGCVHQRPSPWRGSAVARPRACAPARGAFAPASESLRNSASMRAARFAPGRIAADLEIFAQPTWWRRYCAPAARSAMPDRARPSAPAAVTSAPLRTIAAFRAVHQTRDGFEQRGLAGAVRADDRDDLAVIDADRRALEDFVGRAVAGDDAVDGEQTWCGAQSPPPQIGFLHARIGRDACRTSPASACALRPSR